MILLATLIPNLRILLLGILLKNLGILLKNHLLKNHLKNHLLKKQKLSDHVKNMLNGKEFNIRSGTVQHTDGLSEENREIIVSNLMADEEALCRISVSRIRRTFANIDLVGPFGQWLTNNFTRAIHVHLPLTAFYDFNSSRPMKTLRIRKSNIAIHIP